MKVIKPPSPRITSGITIFLAGSIEQGAAEEWQDKIADALKDVPGTILNPRRDAWDSTWVQDISCTDFRGQVEWEMAAMEQADTILMYLDPKTKSPISLLELGLHAANNKLIVACPDGFWRKGNVQIVCSKYGIPLLNSLDELIEQISIQFNK